MLSKGELYFPKKWDTPYHTGPQGKYPGGEEAADRSKGRAWAKAFTELSLRKAV